MQTTTDRTTVYDLTFATQPYEPPPCTGPAHPASKYGHIADQPASYLVVFPCHASYEMCAGWVQRLREHDGRHPYDCRTQCGMQHVAEEIRYHLID